MIEVQHFKLSDLTQKLEGVIQKAFGTEFYWIIAEISSHKFYPDNERHFFEFVEKSEGVKNGIVAKIDGISWESGSQRIKVFESITGQKFTNGIKVLVKVKIEFKSAYGFKLILIDIDQNYTLGNIEKQRLETLARLIKENPEYINKVGEEYITINKKLNFNLVIQRIALIGSPNSDGYADFAHTIKNNQFGYTFAIDTYFSSVQGTTAEKEMLNCLIDINNSGNKYDCLVFIRGGGARTDFLVFDSYSLSKEAAKFPIPIITGIGHHKDVSIVDLMVHTSTNTPTKAAEFIISHCNQFEEKIAFLQNNILIKSQGLLAKSVKRIGEIKLTILNKSRLITGYQKDELSTIRQILINKSKTLIYKHSTRQVALLNSLLSKPRTIISTKTNDLSNIISNLYLFSSKHLSNQGKYLKHYKSLIKVMSPTSILKRGFAIVEVKGKIVCSADPISVGENISITLSKTIIKSKVVSKKIINKS